MPAIYRPPLASAPTWFPLERTVNKPRATVLRSFFDGSKLNETRRRRECVEHEVREYVKLNNCFPIGEATPCQGLFLSRIVLVRALKVRQYVPRSSGVPVSI